MSCVFIRMEDLIANALIELIEHKNCTIVDMEQVVKYGNAVVVYLKEKNIEAVVYSGRDVLHEIRSSCSKIFIFFGFGDGTQKTSISIAEDITSQRLRSEFRSLLSIDMFLAFTDKKSLLELGIS